MLLTHELNDDSVNGIFHLMNIDHSQPHLRTALLKKELKIDVVESNINFIGSVFENTDTNTYLALTNQLFIKLRTTNDLETLSSEFDKYGVSSLENMQNNLYLLTLSEKAELDALEIANKLFESGLVEFADPDFFRALQSFVFTPNDPEYPNEWHIPRIGADAAWCWTNAAYGRIGIMDIGINTSHPDLAGNFIGTYDPTNQPLGVDAHGTLCAGVACAITNNGIGVAGIAWGAGFYSLRIGYNNTGNPDNPSFYSIDSWVVGAFNYAIATPISVISCSFSLGNHTNTTDTVISNFVIQARGVMPAVSYSLLLVIIIVQILVIPPLIQTYMLLLQPIRPTTGLPSQTMAQKLTFQHLVYPFQQQHIPADIQIFLAGHQQLVL